MKHSCGSVTKTVLGKWFYSGRVTPSFIFRGLWKSVSCFLQTCKCLHGPMVFWCVFICARGTLLCYSRVRCVCVVCVMQGLLDLEGSLASVRTHLVKRDQHATDLLDTSNGADDIIRRCPLLYNEATCNNVALPVLLIAQSTHNDYSCVHILFVSMYSVKENLHQMLRSSEDFTEGSYKMVSFFSRFVLYVHVWVYLVYRWGSDWLCSPVPACSHQDRVSADCHETCAESQSSLWDPPPADQAPHHWDQEQDGLPAQQWALAQSWVAMVDLLGIHFLV